MLIVILLAILVIILIPLVWSIVLSFDRTALSTLPEFSLIPHEFSLFNYEVAFTSIPLVRYYLNTIFVTVVHTFLAVFFALMCGYAFAKGNFVGKKFWFIFMLAVMMLPFESRMIPLYLQYKSWGLLDTYAGIVLPSVFSATAMLLTIGAYLAADRDIYDAAAIDGAGDMRYLSTILIPLTAPVTMTIFIQAFISSFNSYLWPLLVTTRPGMRTIQIGITMLGFAEEGEYGAQFASIVIITLPFLILLAFCRKMIMKALEGGLR